MSTYSSSLRIELPADGTQAGTWGDTTNSNLAYILDTSVAGYQTVSVTAASQALTFTNGPTSTAANNQSVYAMLQFTTTTGAAFAVYAPPASKNYIIWNNSNQSMTIYNSTVIGNTTAAGTGVTITNGSKIMVWSDATNFYELQAADLTSTLAIAKGGTGQTTANAAFNALAPAQTSTVTAGSFVVGATYTILTVGTTNFVSIGASASTVGITFVATGVGTGTGTATTPAPSRYLKSDGTNTSFDQFNLASTTTVTSGSFVIGTTYTILTIGTTDFTLIGASANTVGVIFTATGVGLGTGTAFTADYVGVLPVSSGGTGNASQTQYGVLYAATTASLIGDPSVLSFNGTNLSIGTNSSTGVVIGVVYTVASLGGTTLGQWQTLFSALASIPTVAQSITATATGTLAGGATISSANKLTMLGTGSFTNSLVSTSATAADYPTLEFRKTRTSSSGVESNAIGRLSFYSQSGSPGVNPAENAYLDVTDKRSGGSSRPQISLVSYSYAVGAELAFLKIGDLTKLYSQTAIEYQSNISHTFNGNVVFNDAVTATTFSGNATTASSALIRSQTAQATTSGTAIDFTGIPSNVKRVTVMFNDVSIDNDATYLLVQIGSGGYTTTGYSSTSGGIASTAGFGVTTSTIGYLIAISGAASLINGSLVITTLGSNIWVASGVCGSIPGPFNLSVMNSGKVALGGTLDRVRLTTVSGTANFDGGSVNILYE
jgi:hypothetical protein